MSLQNNIIINTVQNNLSSFPVWIAFIINLVINKLSTEEKLPITETNKVINIWLGQRL